MFEVPQEIFPYLVRLLNTNLKYANGILNSEVNKHPIQLIIDVFEQVCNLPYSDFEYDENEGNTFTYYLVVVSFFTYQNFIIPTPYTVGLIFQDI